MPTVNRWKKTKKYISSFGKLINLCTPQSRLLVFGIGLLLAAVWPLEKVGLLPLRSIFTIFGLHPYSTGMTRAMVSLMKGKFILARTYNPLVFVAMSLIGFIVINDILELFKTRTRKDS